MPGEQHKLGFTRKTTKPQWYNRHTVPQFGGNKDVYQWEGSTCGYPLDVPKVQERGAPHVHHSGSSFTHGSHSLTRQQDDMNRLGSGSKYGRYAMESKRTNSEYKWILKERKFCEVENTISGQGRPISCPVLYPQGLTHSMGIQLDGKNGQAVPYTHPAKQQLAVDRAKPYQKTSTVIHMPYARTRVGFNLPDRPMSMSSRGNLSSSCSTRSAGSTISRSSTKTLEGILS